MDVEAVVRNLTWSSDEGTQTLQDAAWVCPSAVANLSMSVVETRVLAVLQSLPVVADSKWEDGEDDSYYSDKECDDEVDVSVATEVWVSVGLCK